MTQEERKLAAREYAQRPEVKAKARAKHQTPEYKAKARARQQTPEAKAKARAYAATAERKAALRAWNQTPKAKAREQTPWCIWNGSKSRARKQGRLHNITLAEFEACYPEDMCCPYCHEKMIRLTPTAPSIDQVIPGLGYVHGNVDVICKLCNVLKSGGTASFHEAVARRQREVEAALMLEPML